MTHHIEASIIIPTKNKLSRLRLVLYALALQINENHEVIVVLDGCNQDTLDGFSQLHLPSQIIPIICESSAGRAAARNHGIRKASGDILIFIDDDRIPGPGFIESHIAAHRNQRCMVLGKRMQLFLPEETIHELSDFNEFHRRIGEILATAKCDITWLKNKVYLLPFISPVPWLACVTSNLSVQKRDMIAVGMFDETFTGWGWEDSDLGYRFLKNHIPMIKQSRIINYHMVHAKSPDVKKEEYHNYRYFYEKTKADPITRFSLMIIRAIRDTGFWIAKYAQALARVLP